MIRADRFFICANYELLSKHFDMLIQADIQRKIEQAEADRLDQTRSPSKDCSVCNYVIRDFGMESALTGLIGVITGAFIAILGTIITTRATLDAQRRKARQDYLTSRMDLLARSLAEYEVWLSKHGSYRSPAGDSTEASEHARIIGEAIAACLAVGDLPEKNDKSDTDITWQALPDIPYRSYAKIHTIHRLAYIANRRLTRNFVTQETQGAGGQEEINMWGHYHDRNRAALDHAVKRLAQLITETQAKSSPSWWHKVTRHL